MLRPDSTEAARIAAVHGTDSSQIQPMFAALARFWQGAGVHVSGVVEETSKSPGRVCGDSVLRDLTDGAIYSISQQLGRRSQSCNIDPGGLLSACAAVERSVRSGCDLVVISKFGKQEAAGGGLVDAFAAALEADVPVLTAVSVRWEPHWIAFSGALSEFLPFQREAIEAWWNRTRGRCPLRYPP